MPQTVVDVFVVFLIFQAIVDHHTIATLVTSQLIGQLIGGLFTNRPDGCIFMLQSKCIITEEEALRLNGLIKAIDDSAMLMKDRPCSIED